MHVDDREGKEVERVIRWDSPEFMALVRDELTPDELSRLPVLMRRSEVVDALFGKRKLLDCSPRGFAMAIREMVRACESTGDA